MIGFPKAVEQMRWRWFLLLASILTKAAAETRYSSRWSSSRVLTLPMSQVLPKRKYIIETQAAGVTAWDYDLDGDPDLYFTIGSHLEGEGGTGKRPISQRWRAIRQRNSR